MSVKFFSSLELYQYLIDADAGSSEILIKMSVKSYSSFVLYQNLIETNSSIVDYVATFPLKVIRISESGYFVIFKRKNISEDETIHV